jgi:capsule polysaccharide export protein KpsE/RkpR
VALMQSTTVADRIIDQFKLMQVYDVKFREVARKKLDDKVQISVGKKDGLITVEVDDEDPQRSAEMANRFVEELRRLTDRLALTEAQQRRLFFEAQMQQTRDRMTKAQQALQASGLDQGAIKAEPRAAAEGNARLMAERTAAEVRLQAMRKSLVDSSPEVQQQLATIAALRSQLARLEANTPRQNSDDYIGKYRAFKYEETLFDLFSKQYELARVDESREGALIQVVDTAMPPERRSRPKRALTAVATTVGAFVALACYVLIRRAWRNSATSPANVDRSARLRAAWRGGR